MVTEVGQSFKDHGGATTNKLDRDEIVLYWSY